LVRTATAVDPRSCGRVELRGEQRNQHRASKPLSRYGRCPAAWSCGRCALLATSDRAVSGINSRTEKKQSKRNTEGGVFGLCPFLDLKGGHEDDPSTLRSQVRCLTTPASPFAHSTTSLRTASLIHVASAKSRRTQSGQAARTPQQSGGHNL
jgi:hypothetical protein